MTATSAPDPAYADQSRRRAAGLSPRASLAILVLATLSVRLIAGMLCPLVGDEAYYRLWSLRPAFGYFDHPPMIAWWIWIGRHLAGDTLIGVRLLPIFASVGTTLLTFEVARLMGLGERVAFRGVLWLNATILMGVGGLLAVPDAPNDLFWMAALWFAFRADRGAGGWWLAAGVAAGLACLSKYSALFLAPGVLLWLASTARGRKTLTTPWPWAAAAVAVAIFGLNIAWNAEHHWATFYKQFGRAAFDGFAPIFFVRLLGDQVLLITPLVAIFVGRSAIRRQPWPLLAVCAPFVAYLVVHSLHTSVEGHWPAPLYPAMALCAAWAAEDIKPTGLLARLRRAAPWFGLGCSAIAVGFILAPLDGRLPFPDPAAKLRDWPAFGAKVEALRIASRAAWVGTPNYFQTALLADEHELHGPVTEIAERERYTFEGAATRADFNRPGLIVAEGDPTLGASLPSCFAFVRPLGEVDRGHASSKTRYFAYLVASQKRDIEDKGCERP